MLLYRAATGRVEEIASTGPAIALLNDFSCSSLSTTFVPADVAALLTDGITEALDSRLQELGVQSVKKVLQENAAAPIETLLERITALASSPVRADDQTVLIVRAAA